MIKIVGCVVCKLRVSNMPLLAAPHGNESLPDDTHVKKIFYYQLWARNAFVVTV